MGLGSVGVCGDFSRTCSQSISQHFHQWIWSIWTSEWCLHWQCDERSSDTILSLSPPPTPTCGSSPAPPPPFLSSFGRKIVSYFYGHCRVHTAAALLQSLWPIWTYFLTFFSFYLPSLFIRAKFDFEGRINPYILISRLNLWDGHIFELSNIFLHP